MLGGRGNEVGLAFNMLDYLKGGDYVVWGVCW
jgi:hypothetical protein